MALEVAGRQRRARLVLLCRTLAGRGRRHGHLQAQRRPSRQRLVGSAASRRPGACDVPPAVAILFPRRLMEYAVLGRSGLVSSVIGLGGGGPSRFGLSAGSTAADAVALIRRAHDLGVTLFDGGGLLGGVDSVLGKAVKPFRGDIVLSSKVNLAPVFWPLDRNRTLHRAAARAAQALSLTASARTVRAHIERTLEQLDTDYIDILHLHALT